MHNNDSDVSLGAMFGFNSKHEAKADGATAQGSTWGGSGDGGSAARIGIDVLDLYKTSQVMYISYVHMNVFGKRVIIAW